MPTHALESEVYRSYECAFFDHAISDADPAAGPREWDTIDLYTWLWGRPRPWTVTMVGYRSYTIGLEDRPGWPTPEPQSFPPPEHYAFVYDDHPGTVYVDMPDRQVHQTILRGRSLGIMADSGGIIYWWNYKIITKTRYFRRLTYIGKAVGSIIPLLAPLLPLFLLLSAAAGPSVTPPNRRRRTPDRRQKSR